MKTALYHTILWIVSFSILNVSIDIADDNFVLPVNSAFETSEEYDQIESITELLMNETTDLTLPDQKGGDQSALIKKAASFDFISTEKRQRLPNTFLLEQLSNPGSVNYTLHLSPGFRTIFSPPPNA